MIKFQPIKWQNVLIGALVGLGVVLIISAVWFYFAGYIHILEAIRVEEELKDWQMRRENIEEGEW